MVRIKTLEDLVLARNEKRSVVCPEMHCFKEPSPAAFVINYTGEIIHRLISSGLYIYEPKTKRPIHNKPNQ